MKTLNINKNFLAIEDKYSNYKDSKVVMLPVPYEATTSYGKGTGKGEIICECSIFRKFC